MIGKKMIAAIEFVEQHPGCCKKHVAEYVGPHGSLFYGYKTVNRAILSGKIAAKRLPNGKYVLTVETVL